MDICLCMLKESNESRFDSYSVRNNVLHISHITFWDCRVHNFPTTFLEIAVYIYIDPFPTNFHITKSHLSLNNTEILRGVHVKYYCKLFLAIVCNSYDWSKSLNTKKKTPFQNGVLYILLRKQPFFKFMHSLCENENICICGESTLTHNKRKCFPLYLPTSLLTKRNKRRI